VRSAPSVRRVVVTSSFAAILDESKLTDPNTVFSEKSWNPVTLEDAHKDQATAYRASKKLAEKAAWDFVADKSNGAKFDLVTINPPMVYGPVVCISRLTFMPRSES
jgi:nucleoside-diphosphate-sugar epimerase